MCKGSLVCGCHNRYLGNISGLQKGYEKHLNESLDQAFFGNASILFNSPLNSPALKFDEVAFKRYYDDMMQDQIQIKIKSTMKITGKEYLVVSGTTIADTTTDLAVAKKRAGELAHSTQGSVYIFQPVLEIAPKRDVVETSITLG